MNDVNYDCTGGAGGASGSRKPEKNLNPTQKSDLDGALSREEEPHQVIKHWRGEAQRIDAIQNAGMSKN